MSQKLYFVGILLFQEIQIKTLFSAMRHYDIITPFYYTFPVLAIIRLYTHYLLRRDNTHTDRIASHCLNQKSRNSDKLYQMGYN